MINGKKIIAVLPAYNAAATLANTVADIPRPIVDDIILVDDASRDETVALGRQLGLTTIVHEHNRGYGGNQKTCYAAALARGADIVVMVHPDHQYDPHYVTELVTAIAEDRCDAAFGSRMLTPGGALRGGMPHWKYVANVALTWIANRILGMQLSEYHSGFRAYSRLALQTVALEQNSDDFIFDTEIIVQLKAARLRIREIAIPTKYFKEASSIGLGPSIKYGLSILGVLAQYSLHRLRLRHDQRFVTAPAPAEN